MVSSLVNERLSTYQGQNCRTLVTGGLGWAAKAKSAQGGDKPKLIGEPPKRPREAAKIFSDEKLRMVKRSGSRPAWRPNTIPRDVQDDYEALPEDTKQGWEDLAADEKAKYQKALITYDKQNPGYSASLGQAKAGPSKPAGPKRASRPDQPAPVRGPKPIRKALEFYIDDKVLGRQADYLRSTRNDVKRYMRELDRFPEAKADWEARQELIQKRAAGPGKTVAQLAQGDSDPELSDDEEGAFPQGGADSAAEDADESAPADADENAENEQGPSKGRKAALGQGMHWHHLLIMHVT
ncbi:hypothetical protein WJX84_004096 [Apatococcus fuscideae]|uniref:HMG box domain-containing protein n=1 Tax=Apatococcus fuscideae TaxID=2026836 RepID=A0AAW1TC05_9CHLO